METVSLPEQNIDEIDWDDLTRDVHKKRCVLFLGRSLPVYPLEGEKVDFYSLAAFYLSEILEKNHYEFDKDQRQNLYYITHKFLAFKKNNRIRLEDEIAEVYKTQVAQLKTTLGEPIPALYKTILLLPWHTIVNMQPDNFFETVVKPNEVFSFYDYKPDKQTDLKLDKDQFLIYNLLGTMLKTRSDYNVSSLVLTEEDHVEFVRNLVSSNPRVPEGVISRFDNEKIFIFLDCNLENWDFRLLMEMLKIHKESHTYSPKRKSFFFPEPVLEFYKNRYGFIFIKNNSEEFINKLWEEYRKRYEDVLPVTLKKMFIAYDDTDEELMRSLLYQFKPWIDKKVLLIWTRDNILPGENPLKIEDEQFQAADSIMLIISAQFLNDPMYERYVKPSLDSAQALTNPKKVFAIIKSACPWQETPINNLLQKNILPANRIPIKLQQQEDPDKILYEIANAITKVLWE
ncbi:MAG: SIR2 family protein [Chitinophagaceae bacterium]